MDAQVVAHIHAHPRRRSLPSTCKLYYALPLLSHSLFLLSPPTLCLRAPKTSELTSVRTRVLNTYRRIYIYIYIYIYRIEYTATLIFSVIVYATYYISSITIIRTSEEEKSTRERKEDSSLVSAFLLLFLSRLEGRAASLSRARARSGRYHPCALLFSLCLSFSFSSSPSIPSFRSFPTLLSSTLL